MKHTPGPWRVVTDSRGFPQHVVAETYETTCSFLTSVKRYCGYEAIDANARLIAAAPELLDELKAVEAHLHAFVEAIEYGGGSASKSADRLASVRAAIAKATGETS